MSIIFKIADSIKVFMNSGRGVTSLLGKGASVASTQVLHNCRHYIPVLNAIIDVGANQGQFAIAAGYFYPSADIYSFEPLPDVYPLLQRNTRKLPRINTYNMALGNSNGTLEFHSNAYSHASSALPVSALQKDMVPKTAASSSIQVAVKRLDDLQSSITFNTPSLLKMDVQGFEKEVLKGAAASLPQIDYLLFETSFVQMYDGEPLFDEMHHFVKELGFEFIAPVGFLQSEKLQILQMDLLYKRKK
ncbi:FkbM family methyltransferase [Chitinophaga arvensicola]|uniref:Methyltransferase, FkbM family n=1 Tax=Chitinophaga arvensicola TaxID=29529 RepID=A0A1I0S4C7_9BACT|nr:FkbM family methyltransferase [Chitinophaga arvensicola]SEW49647.1 methyltransferase, FkbM family [Chitinophaga arvensicola]